MTGSWGTRASADRPSRTGPGQRRGGAGEEDGRPVPRHHWMTAAWSGSHPRSMTSSTGPKVVRPGTGEVVAGPDQGQRPAVLLDGVLAGRDDLAPVGAAPDCGPTSGTPQAR